MCWCHRGTNRGTTCVTLVATRSYFGQGPSMRKILTLCLAGILLTGCESDFDKCMQTELPRASMELRVGIARQTLAKLITTLRDEEISASAEESTTAWVEANPRPSGRPESPKFEPPPIQEGYDNWFAYQEKFSLREEEYEVALKAWRALPEVIGYDEKRDAAFLNIYQKAGAPIESAKDIETFADLDALDKVLMPRAERNGCWGEDECEEPLLHEWVYLSKQDNYDGKTDYENRYEYSYSISMIKTALTESIEWQKEELARLEKLAPETAIRTCNANGFYE